MFLIIFASSSSTVPGNGFRLTFQTLETFCTDPIRNTKYLFQRPEVDSREMFHWPAESGGYGPNELWLMVFQPPYQHEASVDVRKPDIEYNCSHDKLIAYYTYNGVPDHTQRYTSMNSMLVIYFFDQPGITC